MPSSITNAVVYAAPGGGNPLRRLLGMSLVRRIILTLGKAGVERVFVVDGPMREAIESDDSFAARGIDVTVASLDAVKAELSEPFVLARADRVYSRDLIAAAVTTDARDGELHRRGGLYVATPAALDNLLDLDNREPTSRKDVGFWYQVDSDDALRAAEKRLLKSLIKPVDGPVARHVLRRLSLPMTRLWCKTSVTPNTLTLLAMSFGFVGVWFIFQATWTSLAIGGLLIFTQSVLDHNDGEIARLTFQESAAGQWIDHISDDVLSTLYGLSFGWAAAELLDQPVYWWLGIGSAICITLFHVVHYGALLFVYRTSNPFEFRWWFQSDDEYLTVSLNKGGIGPRIVELFHASGRRDVYVFAFLVFCLVRLPQAAVIWYFAVALAHAVLSLIHVAAGGMRSRCVL